MKLIHVFSIFATVESFFDGQFKYLTDQGYEVVVVSSYAQNAEAVCKRNGVRFVPVNIPRSVSPMAIVKAVRKLCLLIREEKVDAVFGHTPVGALCAMIAARVCGVKSRVYYRHGVIYTTMQGLKRTIFKAEERFVASLATSVVNVSYSLSKLAVIDRLNCVSKQNVIGHGTCGGIDAYDVFNPQWIDNEKFMRLKANLGIGKPDIVFGFCGRICNDKGIPELVNAFNMFQKKHIDLKAKLLLIGIMDERDILPQATRDAIKDSKDIVVSGWIKKSEIPYYYSMLDVFVEGICRGMELMLDADLRKRLGENGRKRVLEWYDFKIMWPLVGDLYKKILK